MDAKIDLLHKSGLLGSSPVKKAAAKRPASYNSEDFGDVEMSLVRVYGNVPSETEC